MTLFCVKSDLNNESDVEQKLINNFLTREFPYGLGYSHSDYKTKSKLQPHMIGKSKPKLYFPDYMVGVSGTPLMIIEAKHPNEDVYTGFEEARLYANIFNSKFSHEINPCNKIISCNGIKIIAGLYDEDTPRIELDFEDIDLSSSKYIELIEFCSKETLTKYHEEIIKKIRGKAKYIKPTSNLVGRSIDNEMEINSFGKAVSLDYRRIFIPEAESEYRGIVKNAYVESKNRERNLGDILRSIRATRLPSENDATMISSKEALPLINGIKNYIENKNRSSLILLVGNVGCGKTTFIRYIKNVLFENNEDLGDHSSWVFLNMNTSRFSKNEIFNWVIENVTKQIKEQFDFINFGEKEFLYKLYHKEIYDFENGIGKILVSNEQEYSNQLFLLIKGLMGNSKITLSSIIKLISKEIKKELIVVFDNVDKIASEDQLLIFQVAEWFRVEFNVVTIMPLRSSTYNNNRNQPPLDTVVKDLVFRIDPPNLLTVLQKRMEYIYRLEEDNLETTDFYIENGIRVEYKKEDFLEYIKYILVSIRNDSLIKRIFYSLSGKNVRLGMGVC